MPFLPRTTVDPALDAPLEAESPDADFWGPPERHGRPDRHGRFDGPPGLPGGPVGWGGPLERFGDRVRAWRGGPRFAVAALLVVALVAGVVWYRLGVSSSSTDTGTAPPAPTAASVATRSSAAGTTSTTTGTSEDVTVHVAGAVARPGVYELDGDVRVIDAVEAAGGGVPEADLDRLNLAEKLVDGERVLVQKVGDPTAPAAPGGGVPASSTPGSSGVPAGPVNVNTATQAELEELPGIGPALAQSIIAERERRGGFRAVNELRSVRGIGDKRFADLEPLVTV